MNALPIVYRSASGAEALIFRGSLRHGWKPRPFKSYLWAEVEEMISAFFEK